MFPTSNNHSRMGRRPDGLASCSPTNRHLFSGSLTAQTAHKRVDVYVPVHPCSHAQHMCRGIIASDILPTV